MAIALTMAVCGCMELQTHSITAGSVRMFYAVIYSLFLGFGLGLGSQLWGLAISNPPEASSCPATVDPKYRILLIPLHLVLQSMALQAQPSQIPVMVLLGSIGYLVNYGVGLRASSQLRSAVSAFALGLMSHLYSRSRHGFAFASVASGIMLLVPSGVSATGGLLAGLEVNYFNSTTSQQVEQQNLYSSFSVGAQMIEIAISLTVGLLISALVVYP